MQKPFIAAPLLLLGLAALAGAGPRPGAADPAAWKPAPAPLLTRFARDVRADHPRPEYPRPQFVRREWKNLNGLWEFAFQEGGEALPAVWPSDRPMPLRILVPFTFEAALSGIGKGSEVHERVWYRRRFDVPAPWRDRRVKLNFEGCDWETRVWVNGRPVGSHRGGYEPFSLDVTDALRGSGPQELVVGVYDPADPKAGAYQPKGKQLGSQGIWYTRTTGIWKTVWLEPVAREALNLGWVDTEVDPESRSGRVLLTLRGQSRLPAEVELVLARDGHEVDREQLRPQPEAGRTGLFRLPSRRLEGLELWSPESPALYDLTLRARVNGRVIDEVRSYCAFRRYDLRNGRLALNGKPYFLRGVLDQGYWPDGILTPPSDRAIRSDVELTKRLGFNMARKHVKVDDPRWYYWCDRLGLAVWQDMPSSHNLVGEEAEANFTREWQGVIAAVRSHPSVLHWIPFNENWGNPGAFQDRIVRLTRTLDPSRPITDASGWTQRSLTDVVDAHNYSNNLLREGVEHPVKPKVVGEYGGIALPVPGHTWTRGWGYQTVRSADDLIRRVRFQTTQLFEAPNLSGFVYTQLTDVEQELNGLLTYDRLPKADPSRLAAVFEGRDRSHEQPVTFIQNWTVLGPIPTGTHLATAEDSPANRAVIDQILQRPFLPEEGALHPEPGDTAAVGGAPFRWLRARTKSEALDFHQLFGGSHDNAVAYAVAVIESPRDVRNATLYLGSDDGARVWLNGRQVWSVNHIRGVSPDEDVVPQLSLHAGRNVLVVKVAQGVGGWGLSARVDAPK